MLSVASSIVLTEEFMLYPAPVKPGPPPSPDVLMRPISTAASGAPVSLPYAQVGREYPTTRSLTVEALRIRVQWTPAPWLPAFCMIPASDSRLWLMLGLEMRL